jgi:disulfide bond formation protein DsbB
MKIKQKQLAYSLNFLGILVLSFILISAYVVQFSLNENPCPLCLLQRACLLGVMFGFFLNLRISFKTSHYGISILSAALGAAISAKHILLWVCPRTSGLTGYGSSILGLHLYSWAFLIFSASIVAIAGLLSLQEQFKETTIKVGKSRNKKLIVNISFYLLFTLFFSNFIVTFIASS